MYTPAEVSFKLVHAGYRHIVRSVTLASALSSLALVATDFGSDSDADAAAAEAASTGSCGASFDPEGRYPLLPEVEGPDLSGEAGVVVHLQHHRGVVELGDCLYQLDRPLEIGFGELDTVSLLLELHDEGSGSSELFVSEGEAFETHTIEGNFAVFAMSADDSEHGFELAAGGQAAPTVPVVIAKPVDDGPPPK